MGQEVDISKKLTAKQEKFCNEYMIDLNATQAATRAGYSKKTAKSQGQRLLTDVDIASRIAAKKNSLAIKASVTLEMLVDEYKDIAFKKVTKKGLISFTDKIKALDSLGKHLGFFEKDNKQKLEGLADLLAWLDGKSKGLPSDGS